MFNGYHLGQHRLSWGKQTAFDTDVRVPLIIAGPGVPRGRSVSQVVQNIDLYPTFARLAVAPVPGRVEGHSLVGLLHPVKTRPPWRTVALVEDRGLNDNPTDHDFGDGRHGGDPTTYEAIRISRPHLPAFQGPVEAVYVEYKDAAHEHEYYDIRKDPFEPQHRWTADRTPAGRATQDPRRPGTLPQPVCLLDGRTTRLAAFARLTAERPRTG